MKPRLVTCATVFARRGDPWVSGREGIKDFGRNPDTEDPDFDWFFNTKRPSSHSVFVDPPRVEREADIRLRTANALSKMNKAIRQHDGATTLVSSKPHYQRSQCVDDKGRPRACRGCGRCCP